MRKLLSLFITSLLCVAGITLVSFGVSHTYADIDPFNPNGSNNNSAIPCQDETDCNFEASVEIAKKVTGGLVDSDQKSLSEYIIDIVLVFLQYITLVAVIYVLYSGFRIMTSNGDENTVKTARTGIIYVLVGIVVMWLAYAIVNLVINALSDSRTSYKPQSSYFAFNLVSQAHAQSDAIYSESEKGTFNEYKSRLNSALQDLVSEIQVNGEVNLSSLNEIKILLDEAYKRLPDKSSTDMETNKGKKKLAIIAIDIAKQEPDSMNKVTNVVNTVGDFLAGAKISQISGSIEASPDEGNAPLTVSFRANNVSDPAGTTPNINNYIWWKRDEGGQREDLGRGPSFIYTFEDEGSYTIFLDIKSSSKNEYGYTDVLPITLQKKIEVKPKLGEIILLINGVNVENKSSIKITPEVAARGLIFDATASRAIGNGIITKTRWDFGNGNSEEYDGSPGIERQAYATEGPYNIVLSFESNTGEQFQKEIRIDVQNPAAVIKVDQTRVLVEESVDFSLDSFFDQNTQNIEYNWTIQSDDFEKVVRTGENFSYSFENPGEYIVTLAAKSPDGSIDSDSKIITVESREPIVNIDVPKAIDDGHPNTLIFDGSKSFDPDSNSRDGLSYQWRVNGRDQSLNDTTLDGARGTLTFDEIGTYTVSLTVTNKYGKVATNEQDFEIKSLLAVDMGIYPEVTQIKKPIRFIADSPRADFFEWNFGDGSAELNSDESQVKHTYEETGVYTVQLTVRTAKTDVSNTITRRVYVTDTDQPFAVISASNSSNSIIEEPNLCQDTEAFTINRSEPTTFDARKSINVDGQQGNLSYTWRYMGKINTSQSITETFGDLGCFPISLTVRSDTNGTSYTTEKYIYLKNQLPQLTSVTTQVDELKKDSRKIIVNVSANGVQDPDGVVTSYTWYYKTETDPEPQSLQITQKPEITFVLPNITEKYYFGVVLQDNDGGKVNSENILQKQSPLIVDNANGNVYLPLISLSPSKTTAKVKESIRFTANATTILGSNITSKSQYAWDFDGDGHIDETTQDSFIDYAYERAGTYNMKVRVTYNGVSNVKYQTITVRNPLKASLDAYRLENALYLINTSEGAYDKAQWKFGEYSSDSLYSALIPYDKIPLADEDGVIGELSVSYNDSEVDTAQIRIRDAISPVNENQDVVFQSSIPAENDTITINDSSQGLGISLYGNDTNITKFAIDTDTSVDSSLNGNPADDIDNETHTSYTDGSYFRIPNFAGDNKRERTLKITLFEGDQIKATKEIKLILDFIPETTDGTLELNSIDGSTLTDFEKQKIEELQELIRSIDDDTDRIIIMKKYNILVENWDDSFEKAKSLIDIQELIVDTSISTQSKSQISEVIDQLLIGEAESINNITVAAQLVRDLIPADNANRTKILENLDAILANIDNYETNKTRAKEILELIVGDDTIPTKYKEYIKSQLLIIIEKGEKSLIESSSSGESGEDGQSGGDSESGFMGIIMGIIKVFFFIFGVILLILVGAYIFYRLTRKNSKLAFQDFMIDSVFHARKDKKENVSSPLTKTNVAGTTITTGTTITPTPKKTQTTTDPLAPKTDPLASSQTQTTSQSTDPLTSFEAPQETTKPETQIQNQANTMPDWLKSPNQDTNTTEKNTKNNTNIGNKDTEKTNQSTPESIDTPETADEQNVPDWLKGAEKQENTKNQKSTADELSKSETGVEDTTSKDTTQNTISESTDMPDWLKGAENQESATQKNITQESSASENISSTEINQTTESNGTDDTIPDWLKGAENTTKISTEEVTATESDTKEDIQNTNTSISIDTISPETDTNETTEDDTSIPDWLVESTNDNNGDGDAIPDWLVEAAEEDTENQKGKEQIQESTKDVEVDSNENPPLEIEDIPQQEKKPEQKEKQEEEPKEEKQEEESQEKASITIEDTGTLEKTPETSLVDTAVPNDEVKIIEDNSIIASPTKKQTEKKEEKTNKKTTKKSTSRSKTTRKTQAKSTASQKKQTPSRKKSNTKKSTDTNTNTSIPDWLQ